MHKSNWHFKYVSIFKIKSVKAEKNEKRRKNHLKAVRNAAVGNYFAFDCDYKNNSNRSSGASMLAQKLQVPQIKLCVLNIKSKYFNN